MPTELQRINPVLCMLDLGLKSNEKISSLKQKENNEIEVNGEIGIAQAKALESANIQIVGGSGTDGGLSLGGMLTGLVATDAGKAIVERVAGKSI